MKDFRLNRRTTIRAVAILLLAGAGRCADLHAQTLDAVERNVRRQVGAPATLEGDPNPQPAVQPGYLGVIADDRKDAGRGLRILEVVKGSPAERAGLLAGDLIISINGTMMHKLDDMASTMAPLTAGRKVDFQVQRSGGGQLLTVVLGARPVKADPRFQRYGRLPDEPPAAGLAPTADAANPAPRALLGVRTVPLDIENRRKFKIPADMSGALVTAVTDNSPADRVGLAEGMLITEFDGQLIDGPETLRPLVRAAGDGHEVVMAFYDQNGELHRQAFRLTTPLPGASGPTPPSPPTTIDLPREVPPGAAFTLPNASAPRQPNVTELEARIAELEARIRRLEAATPPAAAAP